MQLKIISTYCELISKPFYAAPQMTRGAVHERKAKTIVFDSLDNHVNGGGGLVVDARGVEQRQAHFRAGLYRRRDVEVYKYAAFGYVAGDAAFTFGGGLSAAV
jgi:hypothetical protein